MQRFGTVIWLSQRVRLEPIICSAQWCLTVNTAVLFNGLALLHCRKPGSRSCTRITSAIRPEFDSRHIPQRCCRMSSLLPWLQQCQGVQSHLCPDADACKRSQRTLRALATSWTSMVGSASKKCSVVSSIESSRLAPAVPRCADCVSPRFRCVECLTGILGFSSAEVCHDIQDRWTVVWLLIASSIFQEFHDFIVIFVHPWWWYWGTFAKTNDRVSEAVALSRVVQRPRSWLSRGEYRRRIRALGGRTGAALLILMGTNPRTGSQWLRDSGTPRHPEPRQAPGHWNLGTWNPEQSTD